MAVFHFSLNSNPYDEKKSYLVSITGNRNTDHVLL